MTLEIPQHNVVPSMGECKGKAIHDDPRPSKAVCDEDQWTGLRVSTDRTHKCHRGSGRMSCGDLHAAN